MPAFAAKLHASRPAPARRRPRPARSCSGRSLPQDGIFYENGPVNRTVDAWTINFGFAVSDSITLGGSVNSFDIWVWEFPGDVMTSVDWSITSAPFGGTVYGSGTVSGANLTDTFLFTNQYGYNIDVIRAVGLNVSLSSGTYYLNLQNAAVPSGDPVYWDENSGTGCHSTGCPSLADQNSVGSIPSEAFDVGAGGNACMPEQQGNFKVIHDFSGKEDGGSPVGVAIDKGDNLYGTTQPQGGNGSVYRLSKAGSSWVLDPLYNFAGGASGSSPQGGIVGLNGILYGGAYGGIQNCASGGYCGLIFGLRPSPTACLTAFCSWTETALYDFTGPTDAWQGGGLVSDRAGNLYGVSEWGGAQQRGAIFELTPSPGGWGESILYSFTGGSDGGLPTDVLVGNDGSLFGATASGGANGLGVVFQLTRSGNAWNEAVLYDMPQDAALWNNPHSMLQDSSGNLFGEYEYSPCCDNTYGRVFMLSPSNGKWVYAELAHGNDQKYFGVDDFYNLAMDAAGNLYGTGGGDNGCIDPAAHGYIFELTRGSGGWQYSTPVYWDNTEFSAGGALALDAQGDLHGTTSSCGMSNQGTVWELTATQ